MEEPSDLPLTLEERDVRKIKRKSATAPVRSKRFRKHKHQEDLQLDLSFKENYMPGSEVSSKKSGPDLHFPTKWVSKTEKKDSGQADRNLGYDHSVALAKPFNGVCNSWTGPLKEINKNLPIDKNAKELKKRQTKLKFSIKRSRDKIPVKKRDYGSVSNLNVDTLDTTTGRRKVPSKSKTHKKQPKTQQTVVKSMMNSDVTYARALIKPTREPPMTVTDLSESLSRNNLKACRKEGYQVQSINMNTQIPGSSYYEGLITTKEPSYECGDLFGPKQRGKGFIHETTETINLTDLGSDLESDGDFEMDEPDGVKKRVRFVISEAELRKRLEKLNYKPNTVLDQLTDTSIPVNQGEVSIQIKTEKLDQLRFGEKRKRVDKEKCIQFEFPEKKVSKKPEIELDLTLDDSQPLKGAVSLSKHFPVECIEQYLIDPSTSLVIEGPPASDVKRDFRSSFDNFVQLTPEDDYAACMSAMRLATRYELLLYKCYICKQDYSAPRLLEQHVEKDHATLLKTAKYTMQCSICIAKFTDYKSLLVHVGSHNIERVFPCCFCSAVFNQPFVTKCHEVNVHQDIHRFLCMACFKRYETRKDLDKHFKTHSSARLLHECHECHKLLSTKDAWNRHVKLLHKAVVKIKCPMRGCKDVFRNGNDYCIHIIRHHQQSKYRKITLNMGDRANYQIECPACRRTCHVDEKFLRIIENH